jgi:hypothetical protein
MKYLGKHPLGRPIEKQKETIKLDGWMDGWMDGWIDGWMDG